MSFGPRSAIAQPDDRPLQEREPHQPQQHPPASATSSSAMALKAANGTSSLSPLLSARKRLSPRARRGLFRLLLTSSSLLGLLLLLYALHFAATLSPKQPWTPRPVFSTRATTSAGGVPQDTRACAVVSPARWFDASLTDGPSAAEVRDRPAARQPRDAHTVWATLSGGVVFSRADQPLRAADLDEPNGRFLKAAARAAAARIRSADPRARNVSVGPVYLRTSRAGVQAAVVARGLTTSGRIARVVTLTAPPGASCILSETRPFARAHLHVVLPYAARPTRLRTALQRLAHASKGDRGLRAIIAARGADRTFASVLISKLGASRFARVVEVGTDEHGNFSRAVTLRDAIADVPSSDIVFFADVDLAISPRVFSAARMNLVRGSQVWFPVFFSLFPYGKAAWPRDGFWRVSSYGMAVMYRSDFDAVGGFGGEEERRYAGWGSEDVDLYNRFRENGRYAVFRSTEPGMLHVWHGKNCEKNEHYESCMRTVFMTIGSQQRLAEIVAASGADTSELTKDALPL